MDTIGKEKGRIQPPENRYRSVKELGVVKGVRDTKSGIQYNTILRRLLYGNDRLTGFLTDWGLTDVSAAGTFEVYDKKVDTAPVEDHKYRIIESTGWKVMAEKMKCRIRALGEPIRARRLTIEEAIDRLRSSAAVGMTLGRDWKDSPELRNMVEEELEAIRGADPV